MWPNQRQKPFQFPLGTHREQRKGVLSKPWSIWNAYFSLEHDPLSSFRHRSCPVVIMSHTSSNGTIGGDDLATQQNAALDPVAARPDTEKQEIIDWDGPDDPENPRNWKATTKMVHVCLVSAFTLYA